MKVTFLATGSPAPELDRADGTSVVVTIGGEHLLVDCGARTVKRLVQNRIDPADVNTLLFSHHHVDHSAQFFEFAMVSRLLGRESLTIYGPEETGDLLDAFEEVYGAELARWSETDGRSSAGAGRIEWRRTTPDLAVEGDGWRVTALPVAHTDVASYAYRFDAGGRSFVFSSDTAKHPPLAEFAAGADVLMHEAVLGPIADAPSGDGLVWEGYTSPLPEQARERLAETHSDAAEAAEIAAAADVDTLVLHHMITYRDADEMRRRAEAVFDGSVVVAEDGLTLAL